MAGYEDTLLNLQVELDAADKQDCHKLQKKFGIWTKHGFWKFCQYMDSEFFTSKKTILRDLADILQGITQKKYKKVIVNLMARIGKSYMISLWCLWMYGWYPEDSIMRNTYGEELANKFSRDIRRVIGLPGESLKVTKKYRKVFPNIRLSSSQKGVDGWALETSKEYAYSCSGMKGAVKGKGCNIALILDDPSKDEEDALADHMHESIWETYLMSHRNRKESSNVPEIVVMTRSHELDITGKLLEIEPDEWKLFTFPALDEKDKSLCGAIVSTEELLKEREVYRKSNMMYIWDAQKQQEPSPKSGKQFPEDMLKRFYLNELREAATAKITAVDFADGYDFFASVCAKIFGQEMYICNVIFTREEVKVTKPMLIKQMLDFVPHKARFEANAGGALFAELIAGEIKDQLNTYIEVKTTSSNKHTRISSRSGIILEHCYFLEEDEYEPDSDYAKFMKNLTSYRKDGRSKHDDAPDVLTILIDAVGVKPNKTTVELY